MPALIGARQRWHAQCVTAQSCDTSPSLMLIFDDARYLFQCPENTMRALEQDRISVKKLKNVFVSSSTQLQSTAGLGAAILTIGDRANADLGLYGPEGLTHAIACMRYHTRREKLKLRVHEVSKPATHDEGTPQPTAEDKNIRVYAFPVQPNDDEQLQSNLQRKRSRSSSPPSPGRQAKQPRRAGADGEDEDVHASRHAGKTSPIHTGAPLDWLARQTDIPALYGKRADEWRRMVISDMFRGGQPYPPLPYVGSDPSRAKWSASPAWNISRLPEPSRTQTALSYLVVGPAVRGKFHPDKVVALGVPKGAMWNALGRNESVTLPDGRVIEPASCIDPTGPPSAFLIASCPSPAYIDNVISANMLASLDPETLFKRVFHIVGRKVINHPRYTAWMATFPDDVEHVVSAPELASNRITFASATILQARLAKLDASIFSMPEHDPAKLAVPSTLPTKTRILATGDLYEMLVETDPQGTTNSRLRHYDYEPESEEQSAAVSDLNVWDDYLKLCEEAKTSVTAESQRRSGCQIEMLPGADIRVTTLGTGSACPSKYRNVTATLLQLPNGRSILLDAGEGTLGQLARHFGTELKTVLRSLSLIFISHMHADHHSGVAPLLHARHKAQPSETLFVCCLQQNRIYLRDMQQLQDLGLDSSDSTGGVIFIHNDMLESDSDGQNELREELVSTLGAKSIRAVPVQHRARCYGLVLQMDDGCKVVYSGDTKPCEALVKAGQGATLLVHEATLDDDKPDVAEAKGHSTFSQALDVAKRMRAKTCLLTHFSQRYPKFPPLSADSGSDTCDIAVAFDLMSLRIGEFWKMKHYTSALQTLFSDFEGDESAEDVMKVDEHAPQSTTAVDTKPKKTKAEKKQERNNAREAQKAGQVNVPTLTDVAASEAIVQSA